MATFAYAPAIRVHIESEKNGILDVSGDITQWNLTRRANTVSSFNFTLQNTQRKYDGQFWPGDRITVEMKRITWVRVFTGTLNTVPVFSAWPRALPLSASCSLKKLQFWPWDPTTQAANSLVSRWLSTDHIQQSTQGDAGLSALVTDSLVKVTDWNPKAIHIGEVPNTWFKWAEDIEKQIDLKATMQAVLGSFATIGGRSVGGQIKIKEGFQALDQAQLNNAITIFSAVVQFATFATTADDQDRVAKIAIAVAGTESGIQNLDHGDRDSLGIFQQRANWGSSAERLDILYATKAFLGLTYPRTPHGFKQDTNWRNQSPIDVAITVQVPDPTSYHQNFPGWYATASAIVDECRKQLKDKLTSVNQGASQVGLPPLTIGSQSTGYSLAATAADLILSRPPGTIRYDQSGTSAPQSASPTVLDCSSLVEWVYYHTTGELLNHRRSEDQYALCQTLKNNRISLDTAKYIQGALLFNVVNGDAEHVGISLGNGDHVAAHQHYADQTKDVNISPVDSGGFSTAALLPNIDYSQAGTTPTAVAAIKRITGKSASLSPGSISSTSTNPGSQSATGNASGQDPFQALIQLATAPPVVSGNIFGGARKLINNQPFLPWLKNVCNSSMRSFCSAPNGDFMAWFPDYYDITGAAAKMRVEPIELLDFTVEWSDQQIVTHEFVTGTLYSGLDQSSGSIVQMDSGYSGLYSMLSTYGIATMDFPEIFKTIYGHSANPKFLRDYLQRFGARPNLDSMPNIQHGQMEFCMALWNFMYYWSAQFNASIPMTFMPELWPGMIIQIPYYNFQAYVAEVTHQGSYGSGGAFTTTAHIIAPALIDKSKRSSLFGMFADILPTATSKL